MASRRVIEVPRMTGETCLRQGAVSSLWCSGAALLGPTLPPASPPPVVHVSSSHKMCSSSPFTPVVVGLPPSAARRGTEPKSRGIPLTPSPRFRMTLTGGMTHAQVA